MFLTDLRESIRRYGQPPILEDYSFLRPQRLSTPTGRPLVSIITCVLNEQERLPRAIQSVRDQTWQDIEYVVVDGGSTDGTTEVISKNLDIISLLLMGKDEGLYDAFNRGVAVSTGDYVAVLNADDWILPDHVEKSVQALQRGADFTFGDVKMHETLSDGTVRVHDRRADPDYATALAAGTTELHHSTMMVRREIFEHIGLFRKSLKIAADYDWFIRMHKAGYLGAYSGVVSIMTFGGVSTRRQELSILEAAYVAWANGGPPVTILKFWFPRLARRLLWRARDFARRNYRQLIGPN